MYEFLSQQQLYIVLCISMLTWFGIVWYLVRLNRKIEKLEKQLKKD